MASDSLIVQKSRLLQPYKIELKSVNSKVEITPAMLVYGDTNDLQCVMRVESET